MRLRIDHLDLFGDDLIGGIAEDRTYTRSTYDRRCKKVSYQERKWL